MKGYTLIELLVTITITMILFTGVVAGYNKFTDESRIKQVALTFKNDLRAAQNKAISGIKPLNIACTQLVGYTVIFTATTYATQATCNPAQPLAPVLTVTLKSPVQFSPVPPAVTFGVLTQGVNINSDALFTLKSGSKKYVLDLSPQGDITDEGFQ